MAAGLKRDVCLEICGLSKSQFYRRGSRKKRGRKKTLFTEKLVDNQKVRFANRAVIDAIKELLNKPNIEYGYRAMSNELQLNGWFINHKKVYRLMKTERLLRPKLPKEAKNYVKYRVLAPEGPLCLLEQDIKQVWIEQKGGYAYILTIIDIFTRCVLHWQVGDQMKEKDVRRAWEAVIENWLQPLDRLATGIHIEVRNDNGPQFRAVKLQDFLAQNTLCQTFTHPYTPQENGHIESFHAILGRTLEGMIFEKLMNLEQELQRFYVFYNYRRIHGSTCGIPPMLFWQQWTQGNIERHVKADNIRKATFRLTVGRQYLQRFEPAGNENSREVLSLIFEGSIPDKITLAKPTNQVYMDKTKSDGAVLIEQPAVQRSPSVVLS